MLSSHIEILSQRKVVGRTQAVRFELLQMSTGILHHFREASFLICEVEFVCTVK